MSIKNYCTLIVDLNIFAATMSYTANPFATVTPPPRPSINQIRQDPWTANTTSVANPFLS